MPPKSVQDVRKLARGLREAAAQSRKILPPPPAGSATASPSLLPGPIALRRQGL